MCAYSHCQGQKKHAVICSIRCIHDTCMSKHGSEQLRSVDGCIHQVAVWRLTGFSRLQGVCSYALFSMGKRSSAGTMKNTKKRTLFYGSIQITYNCFHVFPVGHLRSARRFPIYPGMTWTMTKRMMTS